MAWVPALLLAFAPVAHTIYDWSFQQRLVVPEAGATFGLTSPALFGRGFLTLISGYDERNSTPGIFVHTTDEGYIRNGQYVWSQQAKLLPKGTVATDRFGSEMVSSEMTLIVSAPSANNQRGYVYVYNGTQRHWSQVQRLQAFDGLPGDTFGEKMSMYDKRMVIAARGQLSNAGAVYVYERQTTGLFWSLQSKLLPRDPAANSYFGRELSLHSDTAVIGSVNDVTGTLIASDDANMETGSAYIFRGTGALWSQQQKLVAADMSAFKAGKLENLNKDLGQRYLGPSLAITTNNDVAIGVQSADHNKTNRQTVYMYTYSTSFNKWSLQQKLFNPNESWLHPEIHNYTEVYTQSDQLFTTVHGPAEAITYIFKSQGSSWSVQAKLLSYNNATDTPFFPNPEDPSDRSMRRPPVTAFMRPILWGGTLIHQADNEIHMRTPYRNNSCLQLWMSDHFRDGWDTAVLTVRAPDLTYDTFHPHCDQVEPFMVRYCPYTPDDTGVYIAKVFAPTNARFYWEISWQVYEEYTGKWYKGDFATKMLFNFDKNIMAFQLVGSENLVTLQDACFRCETLAKKTWAQSQQTGNSAFWPLVAYGAPYYISDYQGRNLYVRGKVCDGVQTYQCYQTLTDGFYTLRLGQGLFGPLTGFPLVGAFWEGCERTGGVRDQFVFQIAGGKCQPVQVHNYTWRCDRPPAVSTSTTPVTVPTTGGTMAPTQSVYGDPYIKGQMYARIGREGGAEHRRRPRGLEGATEGREEGAGEGEGYPSDHVFHFP